MMTLSHPLTILVGGDRLILLPLIILCLGVCFVWAVWEIEQARAQRCQRQAALREARLSTQQMDDERY
jgi:cytochrome c-type biogenesis protein CcmH/NrfG